MLLKYPITLLSNAQPVMLTIMLSKSILYPTVGFIRVQPFLTAVLE